MNKNGFTLIELLAVISILAILVVIAMPNVLQIYNDSKKNTFVIESQEILKQAISNFISDSIGDLSSTIIYTTEAFYIDEEGKYIYTNEDPGEVEYYKERLLNLEENKSYTLFLDSNGNIIKAKIWDNNFYYSDENLDGIDYSMVDVNRIKEGPCSNDSNNIVSVEQKTFAEDSWETIANAVKAGKATAYEVGDKKEITIDGYGTLTVRVANNTTPNECTAEGFSQTACGFVVEFEDVITTYNMNTNVGGWKDSEMRSWLNTTLYNALPKELKKL